MKFNILIGGKAGQGINKISEIISKIMSDLGYFTFNYRDYPSLIRGGHNFNILTLSDKPVGSNESGLDAIIAMDKNTLELHKSELNKGGYIIDSEKFKEFGRNMNIAQAAALLRILGIDKQVLIKEINKEFGNDESVKAAEKGYESEEEKMKIKKQSNKISLMSGTQAIAQGAINSNIDLYIAYPMTPATGVLHELASKQIENNFMVFQPENEIAAVNQAMGASFAGAKTMTGTSGGGFDLMSEGLSMQGMSEIPLVVYLSSRPGPGTGVPTYSSQADLDIAINAGHGEFSRCVVAPGDAKEAIEKTNEVFYLAENFSSLSVLLADKHLAESQFSFLGKPNNSKKITIKRKIPGEAIVKATSYENDGKGNTIEDEENAIKGAERRLKNYENMRKYIKENFEMIKIHGKKSSKNLVIGWGSTKAQILDAIEGLDCKFLQVLYVKPFSDEIKKHMNKAENIILIEQNVTGQLGRRLREKTGIVIPKKNRILKTDARPFKSDLLNKEIKKRLK